jgi:hypothetical protein
MSILYVDADGKAIFDALSKYLGLPSDSEPEPEPEPDPPPTATDRRTRKNAEQRTLSLKEIIRLKAQLKRIRADTPEDAALIARVQRLLREELAGRFILVSQRLVDQAATGKLGE